MYGEQSGNFLLMLRQKHKPHEMTHSENDKVKDIYQMFSMEEARMSELLQKYQTNPDSNPSPIPTTNRTIEVSSDVDVRYANKKRQVEEIRHIELPKVGRGSVQLRKAKSRKGSSISRVQSKTYDPYRQQLKPEQKDKVKSVLEKSYLAQKAKKIRSKSPPVARKVIATRRSESFAEDFSRKETPKKEETVQQKQPQQSLPMPLGYFRKQKDHDEASSDEGDVPLTYYERTYKNMIKDQCLQETNFLYFGKNESMKDWTEGLLLLFQKHDKELLGLRRRCKYLQKFDENFFAVDIFRDD